MTTTRPRPPERSRSWFSSGAEHIISRSHALSAISAAVVLVLAACTSSEEPENAEQQTDSAQAVIGSPEPGTTVIDNTDPVAAALDASAEFFDSAPAVVLAAGEAAGSHQAAGSTASDLAMPVLLTPGQESSADLTEDVVAELDRLGASTVLATDDVAAQWAEAELDLDVVTSTDDLPPLDPPEPVESVAVIAAQEHNGAATVGTARASGAPVHVLDDADPRSDPEVIDALAEQQPERVVGIGQQAGGPEQLSARVAVAETGIELPGGGQRVFPDRRMVALYGSPGTPSLGVLGEQEIDEAVSRVEEQAAEYEGLVDRPVVPTFEIITTIASGNAGPEGDYSRRVPMEEIQEWVDAAGEAGVYVVLDLQPGHTDFLTQAQEYEELLTEPHVGLALDPEWRLESGQTHMEQVGSVTAEEVNEVADWLAGLTREHQLPQKTLVLHQFQTQMISDRENVELGHDELAVLVHADGNGTPQDKLDTYDRLTAGARDEMWWGWKNFHDEDDPMFTPEQTLEVEPQPVFVSYQ